jgi:hypothetical protein
VWGNGDDEFGTTIEHRRTGKEETIHQIEPHPSDPTSMGSNWFAIKVIWKEQFLFGGPKKQICSSKVRVAQTIRDFGERNYEDLWGLEFFEESKSSIFFKKIW